ncbi:MAG: ATP-dependent Clp protease adaptor ClpS [Fimbriimonadaceae bacterium]
MTSIFDFGDGILGLPRTLAIAEYQYVPFQGDKSRSEPCANATVEAPVKDPKTQRPGEGTGGGGWIVTVFNNEHNTYEEVVTVLMAATGCTSEEAYIETWEIDHLGKSVVHFSSEEECNEVGAAIGRIGIRVEVGPDS